MKDPTTTFFSAFFDEDLPMELGVGEVDTPVITIRHPGVGTQVTLYMSLDNLKKLAAFTHGEEYRGLIEALESQERPEPDFCRHGW